jgi:uncharacterized protein YndB with AHSA1/START domain
MHVEASVVIQAPIEAVFGYVIEPSTIHEWQGSALYARLEADRPVRVGSRTVETRKFLGQRLESTMEVTELEPPRRFAIQVLDGPVPFSATADLSVEPGGGTRVDWTMEGESRGFFRVAEPIVERVCGRELRHSIETMRDLLEARYERGEQELEYAGSSELSR